MPDVARSITIPRRPSQVWRWFESGDGLRQWLAPTLDIDLRIGGSYRMRGADDDTWICGVVLDLVPEAVLVLSWEEEDAGWTHPGRLVIALTATREGTIVHLTHDGFAGIGSPRWQQIEQAYDRGADRHQVLQSLSAAVLADA